MEPPITADGPAAQLGGPERVVFDATDYLPNEPKDGRAEYLAVHITGARYFDIDAFADTDTDPVHSRAARELDQQPLMMLGTSAGDGTAGLLTLPLLRAAVLLSGPPK